MNVFSKWNAIWSQNILIIKYNSDRAIKMDDAVAQMRTAASFNVSTTL